jgi:hypothetical protein
MLFRALFSKKLHRRAKKKGIIFPRSYCPNSTLPSKSASPWRSRLFVSHSSISFHSALGLAVDHSRDDLVHHVGPECREISILEFTETVRVKRRTASACNVKNTEPQCGLRISCNSAVPAQYSFTIESDNELYFAMSGKLAPRFRAKASRVVPERLANREWLSGDILLVRSMFSIHAAR